MKKRPVSRSLRRRFLLLAALLLLVSITAPVYAVDEVGLLTWKSSELYEKAIESLQESIRDNSPHVVLVRRDANCSRADFDRHLAEFSSRQVKALVVLGSEAALMALAHDAAKVLPTVALCVTDPLVLGLADSRELPGYPLTGVSYFIPLKKHLSLFTYLYPEARKLAFLYDPGNPTGSRVELPEILRAGRAIGLEVIAFPVAQRENIGRRVREAVAAADMVVLATNKLIFGNAGLVVQAAGDVPVFSLSEEGVPAGAVAALYADRHELGRIAAGQVRQILEGTAAGDIPFHYPQSERLSVNLASARRWGILIPRRVMERPSMVWRSSSQPEWDCEDGSLKRLFHIQNDPDGGSYLRIGLICHEADGNRPFLAGVFKGLQLGRSNYEIEMVDVKGNGDQAVTTLEAYQRDVDLIMTVGGGLLDLVKDKALPVPVVFTGALVSDEMTLSWRNPRMTGSTYLIDRPRQVAILEDLFGEDAKYLLVQPFSSGGGMGESYLLYLEMLTSGFDVERVGVPSVHSRSRQAERLFTALAERRLPDGQMRERLVLVVPNEGEVYRCLPELGDMLSDAGLSVPVYVTSTWGLRWGGTVAPDVDPEEVGLVAGRYAVQILEQGIYPRDLPVWGGRGISALSVNRRWKEISHWSVPASWKGRVREIVMEGIQ